MPSADTAADTPLMRQYQDLKANYPDAVLFFRLGDFYEMFGSDAQMAAPLLGLTLTHRQNIPMCGIPYHTSAPYVARLLKAGHKVAIADQMEEASAAKKLVHRSVTRLITPGTVLEDELLEPRNANYLAAVEWDIVGWGAAFLDVSTGEFWATQALNDSSGRKLFECLGRVGPSEILVPPALLADSQWRQNISEKTYLTPINHQEFLSQSPSWVQSENWTNFPLAAKAALQCLSYATAARAELKNIFVPVYREPSFEMQLDETAIRTLDLVASSSGRREHSLWGFLDQCRTAMGSRKLKDWILHPLTLIPDIEKRQSAVADLTLQTEVSSAIAQALSGVADIPRLLNRLATRSASPRDLGHLRYSLIQIPILEKALSRSDFCPGLSVWTKRLLNEVPKLRSCRIFLEESLVDDPPLKLHEGKLIRDGYSAELDELRALTDETHKLLSALEENERRETKIQSLKAGYNSIFGFYIEVTKAHKDKVPDRYIRRQTLVNAERYITPELKELETKILSAEEKIKKLETSLFEKIRLEVLNFRNPLVAFSTTCAELDVLTALAHTAALYNYVKPTLDLSYDLEIGEGQHPVIASLLSSGQFIANSLSLSREGARIIILTGPNMSGKSTYLRQNALIVLMAQIGSFVPAASARIGIVDKILTRVGAQDALTRGASTFMVEMTETAHILKSATPRSLIILDEVGRGTSTFDGISIAWAVVEHLQGTGNSKKSLTSPRVLFATHYFELTEMALSLKGIANCNVETKEWTNSEGKTEIVFLHKISEGPADRSYGIHVAALAGIPSSIISRAQEILIRLENESAALRSSKNSPSGEEARELPLFETHPVLETLRLVDPEKMTPLEALSALSALKKKL